MVQQESPRSFQTFLVVWISQSISLFGSAITYFVTIVWVTQVLYAAPEQRSRLAFMLSMMSLVYAIASVISAPIAGTWADRYQRKRIIIAADLVNACVCLILTALLITNSLGSLTLLLFLAISAASRMFHGTALDASYALIVPEEKLERANGMMQTMWSLSGVIGPGIATAILAAPVILFGVSGSGIDTASRVNTGTALALAIDAVSFVIAAGALLFVRMSTPVETTADTQPNEPQPGLLAEAKAGATFILRQPHLVWLLLIAAITYFAIGPAGLLEPLIIKINVASDWSRLGYSYETALAMLVGVGNVGGVAGGILISWWGGFKVRRIYGVLLFMLILAAAEIIYGLSSLFYPTILMAAVINGALPIWAVHLRTILQTQTPHQFQGRVFALYRLIAQVALPSGTLLAGWAAGVFSPGSVVALLGVLLLVFGLGQLLNRSIYRTEDGTRANSPRTPLVSENG
jgi:MFS-type transporter involved in bile tolerance (Atg22 family)